MVSGDGDTSLPKMSGKRPDKDRIGTFAEFISMNEDAVAIKPRELTIEEAAERLKTSKDWLYRHWRKLPFTVQLSPKQLRFSTKGIERYLEEKQRARTSI